MGSLPNLHELSKEKLSPVHRAPLRSGFGSKRLPSHTQSAHGHSSHKRMQSSGNQHASTLVENNDAMLEHMATYSPISCRSTRTSALSWRRRDSMNSSAGTSSVRRLIAAVRNAPSGPRPPKKAVLRHCAALILGHASCSAATLPILPLQAGLSIFDPTLGPMLVGLLFSMATLTSCFAPIVTHKLGTNLAICLEHLIRVFFVGAHLYPKWYLLLPGYALMGAWTTPGYLARTSHVNVSATTLSFVYNTDPEDPDECRRDCLLRRLSRAVKLAEDMGLAIGCLVTSLIIRVTKQNIVSFVINSENEIEEVCGAEYCPEEIDKMYYFNETTSILTMAPTSSKMIISIWLGFAVLGFGISCAFLDARMKEPQSIIERNTTASLFKSVRNAFQDPKLQLAAPLTLFIGLEQGFIYSDFTEAYVGCVLSGAGAVALSFLSLAFLQAIAGATLSMLMRHIRRYFVVGVGLAFHSCLLLVLLVWRPAGDDPALFHVISAAWGVCNAIWETLIYTLLLGLHPGSWHGPLATSLFWRWLGLALALGLHGLVCTRIRVIGLSIMLVLAVMPYTWLEIRLAKRGKSMGTI